MPRRSSRVTCSVRRCRSVLALLAAAGTLAAGCGGGAAARGTGPAARPGGAVDVLAASSLAPVLPQLVDGFRRDRPGAKVRVSTGASNALAEQVRAGAPADVVLAADLATAERAAAAFGRGTPDPVPVATTVLVVAVPSANPGRVRALADLSRRDLLVGLCAPQVPCGTYARALLREAGVDAAADTEEPDARSLMAKVASGDLDAGVVYRAEALAAGRAVDVVEVPEAAEVPVTYYAVVRPGAAVGDELVAYLRGPGRTVLARAGFGVP